MVIFLTSEQNQSFTIGHTKSRKLFPQDRSDLGLSHTDFDRLAGSPDSL